jgi:hypothetical protein
MGLGFLHWGQAYLGHFDEVLTFLDMGLGLLNYPCHLGQKL